MLFLASVSIWARPCLSPVWHAAARVVFLEQIWSSHSWKEILQCPSPVCRVTCRVGPLFWWTVLSHLGSSYLPTLPQVFLQTSLSQVLPGHHLNSHNPLLTCTFSPIFSFSSSTYHLLTYCILYQFSDMLELFPSRIYSPTGQCTVFVCAQCSTSCSFSSVACLSPFQVLGDSCITLWTAVEGSGPEHATLYLLLCPGHLVSPWGQQMWYPCLFQSDPGTHNHSWCHWEGCGL